MPTGNVKDILATSRGKFAVSFVDSANPVVFVRGRLEVEVEIEEHEGQLIVHKAALARTARRLADGQVYVSRARVAAIKLEASPPKSDG